MEFLTKAELLAKFKMSNHTYRAVNDEKSPDYIPDFPKPVKCFTGNKHRFSSLDVDAFIMKHSNVASNEDQSSAA